ncbi:molybdopterin-binding protein [Nocardioides sp. SLBN-35]|nr:molybdopterin-binding protein [Nocardioides sp. SLBN-35]
MRQSGSVTDYRVAEAAELLGVSTDTVRRWIEAGRVPSATVDGRTVIPGVDLAGLAASLVDEADRDRTRAGEVSARNRMTGIVTRVLADTVMAQVEMVCGPYRVVSLMSAEAAAELGLAPGVRAIASVKSTTVVVERPVPRKS